MPAAIGGQIHGFSMKVDASFINTTPVPRDDNHKKLKKKICKIIIKKMKKIKK